MCIFMYVFCVIGSLCLCHWLSSTFERSRVWRAKRRLGALTLMDLLWSVLNHGNLPSPNCAALYHRDGSSCVSSKIKYYGCYHCTLLLYHHNGAKHQRKELPAASPAPSPLSATNQTQVHNKMYICNPKFTFPNFQNLPYKCKFTITCMQSKVYISKFSSATHATYNTIAPT